MSVVIFLSPQYRSHFGVAPIIVGTGSIMHQDRSHFGGTPAEWRRPGGTYHLDNVGKRCVVLTR